MSKAQILAELPTLQAEERRQVFERLCELQENDILQGAGPTAEERHLLDQSLAEFDLDGDSGTPWREALQSISQVRPS